MYELRGGKLTGEGGDAIRIDEFIAVNKRYL